MINGAVRIEVVKATDWGDSVRGFYDGRQIHAATIDRQRDDKRYDWLEKFRQGIGADHYFNPDEENEIDQAILNAEVLETSSNTTCITTKLHPIPIADLIRDNPTLHEPIIDGLIRRKETGNLIAASKEGKSWLMYHIGLSVATGLPLFGHETILGRVLLVDNELHKPTIAKRIPTVADALQLRQKDYADSFDVLPVRGKNVDLHDVTEIVERCEAGRYDLIIADAFYRFLPAGVSENDNQHIMSLFNRLDACNEKTGAAWLNVHHASKGSQGGKSVTDTGAGAGSQSRAADAHIVLREHEEPGVYVLDAAVRSFPPIDPIALRFVFPLWEQVEGVETEKLKGRLNKQEQRQIERDREGMEEIMAVLKDGPATPKAITRATAMGTGRRDKLLARLIRDQRIEARQAIIRGNETTEYLLRVTEQRTT